MRHTTTRLRDLMFGLVTSFGLVSQYRASLTTLTEGTLGCHHIGPPVITNQSLNLADTSP